MQISPENFPPDLAEKFVKQQQRSHDRDYQEDWMQYENFGEFYAEMRRLLVMGFMDPDELPRQALAMYIGKQLRNMSQFTREASFEQMDELTRRLVNAQWIALALLMQQHWPEQLAEMRSRRPLGL